MPEFQPSVPATPATIPMLAEVPVAVMEDPDYPIGWECADPALQIAQWGQEARSDHA